MFSIWIGYLFLFIENNLRLGYSRYGFGLDLNYFLKLLIFDSFC